MEEEEPNITLCDTNEQLTEKNENSLNSNSKEELELNMTLYDLNKQMIEKNETFLSNSELKKCKEDIIIPYFQEKIKDFSYFMLLCNEQKDYTVFNTTLSSNLDFCHRDKIVIECADKLLLCLKNRNKVYSIDRTEDNVALEIWLANGSKENGTHCYYLFPYDEGVIEI